MKIFDRIRAERTTHCWKINCLSFSAVLARIQGNFLLIIFVQNIFSIMSQNVWKCDLAVQRKWRNFARARTRECRNLCSGSAQPRGPPQHHPVWAGNWPENPGVFRPVLPGWKKHVLCKKVSEHEIFIKRFQIFMWFFPSYRSAIFKWIETVGFALLVLLWGTEDTPLLWDDEWLLYRIFLCESKDPLYLPF